jgi:predicted amidohydrolase
MSMGPANRPAEQARNLAEMTPRYLTMFTDMAVKYNVNIIGGSTFAIEEGSLYNIAYLFRRNGTLGKQYKLHITPSERKWWGVKPGSTVEVFDTDRGKVSILI